MTTITKEFRFEAAHKLPGHDGKCARLHGHSWVMRVSVRRNDGTQAVDEGPKAGMVMDFGDLKAIVQPLVDGLLDHHYLNETLPLQEPTSERVAAYCFGWINGSLPEGVELVAVEVDETCTSSARYEKS